MNNYILAIEQIIKEEKPTEYANVKKYDDEQSALTKYYEMLSNVSADLGKSHTYMNIKIIDSYGVVLKEDIVGKYLYHLPKDEPTEEETE